ncbi:MAG: ATP-binding protein [Neptuniibacter sp.]
MRLLTLGIRQRVLIVTLLPLLMITFLLGGYFINTQLDDAQSALLEKGKTMSHMMASSAEFGMLIGNTEILSGLMRSAIRSDNEVVDVIFLDGAFETLVQGNPETPKLNRKAGYPLIINQQIYFLSPVVATGVDFTDSPDLLGDSGEPELLGWVTIVLSKKPTEKRQSEILTRGVLLAALGFLITLFIALRFGQRITNPILGLTHVVEQLQEGHLETRASTSSTGELRSLAQGINKLAQRVHESNQTLESRVEKATKRLRSTLVHLEKQNQALDRAKKRADLANLAKDEFLARMSHELRTPLTSVSGFSRLLDQTELQKEQKEYTRIINLTSDLLLSIIDDILDYSKLESNAIELESIAFDLENAILDVIDMQTVAVLDKGLELIPIISSDVPIKLLGDPVRVKQVISNLVSNAVKFTNSGYVTVQVCSKFLSSNECKLEIIVEDTGTGIPEDRLKNLFKAFTQADTSITRKYGGSGLGLVIAKRLTELMGGSIRILSEENKGTKVILNIPFTTEGSTNIPNDSLVDNIILYDAQPLMRNGLKNRLILFTSNILLAENEKELEAYVTHNPDVPIIWGLGPGDISGDTITSIRSILSLTTASLIILSTKPLPLAQTERLIQVRKPTRSRLLLNALAPNAYKSNEKFTRNDVHINPDIKVLIAEDNDFNRLLIRRILEGAGCQVYEATTGEEAVKHSIEDQPEIILMDVHMPVMDGIEATKEIRLSNKDIPIIALTANVIASEHQRLINAGVNYVLLKPINDRELCATINQYTSNTSLMLPEVTAEEENQLGKYNISESELADELKKQLTGIVEGFDTNNTKKMRHHCHQLNGLAGLYDIPEIEVSGYNLYESLIKEDIKQVWKNLWQLKRVINNQHYLSEDL